MIPPAARRGDYAFTSTLDAFDQLLPALASVDLGLADIVQVNISVADAEQRAGINPTWRALFGQPESWPALRMTQMTMPPGVPMQIQATAVAAGGGRKAILAAGVGGSRVGDLFVTSSVSGRSADGTLPTELKDEIAQALDNVCALVKDAGGSPDDLLHFWAFAIDGVVATDFTPSWLARFPTDGDRPARKTFLRAALSGPERVTFQATAKIGGGKRTNHEVPWVKHNDPLPMGARIGNLFMTSGVLGNPPDASAANGLGPLAPTIAGQLADTFANLDALLVAQNAKMTDVVLIGAILPNYADLGTLQQAITSRFPSDRTPALQLWNMPLAAANQKIQLFATAVI
jgi:enamine deaminase RidA (YjgF/YER057c/UK114 family)